MRPYLRIVCAILLTGFISGSSATEPTDRPVNAHLNAGDRLTIQVITFDDDVRKCYLMSPKGKRTEFKPNDNSFDKFKRIPDTELSRCRATINIEVNDDGLWTLKSEAANGRERIQIYNITVSSESDAEEHQNVEFLAEVFKNTTFGARHNFIISDFSLGDTLSCHIINPSGERADVMELGAHGINDEYISRLPNHKCAVSIGVSQGAIGDWMLISVGHRYGEKIERRLPFTIHVERFISGSPATEHRPVNAHLNAGDRLTIEVITFDDDVRKCYLMSPKGIRTEFKPNDNSFDKFKRIPDTELSRCRATINIEVNDDGLWTLNSEAANGRERIKIYNITVSSESDAEEHQHVEFLEAVFKNTTIGARHNFIISDFSFGDTLSCHIINPSGERVDVMKLDAHGINDEYISRLPNYGKCAVSIGVSQGALGDWMLISVGHRYTEKIERRLPFTIHVEQFVKAASDAVDVREGNNFYIALKYVKYEHSETCRLLAPKGVLPTYTMIGACAYKVFNVKMSDSGNWEINYGDKILYRAITRLNVLATPSVSHTDLSWTRDRPVNETLGPDNAVYCRLRSPEGFIVYNGFGRCKINLDRAIKSKHEGVWKMEVGMPGQVIADTHDVTVVVQEPAPKPTVRTRVIGKSPDDIYMKNMTLSCSLASPDPIRLCKFRDPSGRILIAAEAVGESRYSWHGTRTDYTADIYAHECGIRIANTTINDFGIWRCEIDTEGGVYYGFITAKPLWIRDPEIAASITTVPTLTADRSSLGGMAGDSVTMTCSIQAPIRYCYFRARNGTVFNVAPSASHDLATYVGAGFEAGECGVRFPSLSAADSGYWSCHVGLLDLPAPEQRARFEVTINDTMVVYTYLPNRNDKRLIIEARVNNERPLDYCRFVRIDGFGFTSTNTPSDIKDRSHLDIGFCSIWFWRPSDLDKHPWVVVAKVKGQDTEVTGITDIAFPPIPPGGGTVRFRLPGAWIIVMSIGMCMILLASFIGPKKNREWTYARASALRNSFVAKKVQQSAPEAANNTAVAA